MPFSAAEPQTARRHRGGPTSVAATTWDPAGAVIFVPLCGLQFVDLAGHFYLLGLLVLLKIWKVTVAALFRAL